MKVIETIPTLDELKLVGELEGKTSIYLAFYYEVTPILNNELKFRVTFSHSMTGDISGRLDLKGNSLLRIQTDKIPSIEYLYSLIHDAYISLIPLIANKAVYELGLDVPDTQLFLQLRAPSREEAFPALQKCIDQILGSVN